MLGDNADSLTREQIEEVAEGALAMQEQHAQDVLSLGAGGDADAGGARREGPARRARSHDHEAPGDLS